jgi:hypothetical protein
LETTLWLDSFSESRGIGRFGYLGIALIMWQKISSFLQIRQHGFKLAFGFLWLTAAMFMGKGLEPFAVASGITCVFLTIYTIVLKNP